MELPVEIKLRYAQQGLLSSIRPDHYVLDILAAQMHMRSEGVQRDVLFDRRLARDFPVVSVRRNIRDLTPGLYFSAVYNLGFADVLAAYEHSVNDPFGQDLVSHRTFRKPQPKH